jgi:hypothetical protein
MIWINNRALLTELRLGIHDVLTQLQSVTYQIEALRRDVRALRKELKQPNEAMESNA